MSNITVHCGINNPECSPSRVFEINSLNFERFDMSNHQLEIATKMMVIIANCAAIIEDRDTVQTIADITIADNNIFHRIIGITKLIRDIDNFNPFHSPLDYVRAVNKYIYKTKNERAFSRQNWKALMRMTTGLKLSVETLLSELSDEVFYDGLTTVYNEEDHGKLVLVPTSSVVTTFNVTEEELYYGVIIKCNNEEIALHSQKWEDIIPELEEVLNSNTELFNSAIGVIAAFMS